MAAAAEQSSTQGSAAAWPTAEQMRGAKREPLSADAHSEEIQAPETVGPPQPPPPRTGGAGPRRAKESAMKDSPEPTTSDDLGADERFSASLAETTELFGQLPPTLAATALEKLLETSNTLRMRLRESESEQKDGETVKREGQESDEDENGEQAR